MEAWLGQLAGFLGRRRRVVVAIWGVLVIAGAAGSLHETDHLSGGGWSAAGSESARADAAIRRFPGATGAILGALVTGASRAEVQKRAAAVRRIILRNPDLRAGQPAPLAQGRAALVAIAFTGPENGQPDVAKELRHELVETNARTKTRVIGQAALWSNFQEVSKDQLAKGELFGFPIILIVLLAVFGTAVAASAPPALGLASVLVTGALVFLLSRSIEMSIYVQNISSMLGIGVAVDYSLFIVSRFRRELAQGRTKEEAVEKALVHSGHAVVVSGATVAVSLAGLFVINLNAIRSMAIGAILVVCVSVLAAVTLLPALLSLAGHNIERLRLRLPWRTGSDEAGTSRFWESWTRRMLAHPLLALSVAASALLLVAAPLLAIKTLERAAEQLPKTAEVRAATEEAQRLGGPGITGPIHLIVSSRPVLERIRARVRSLPGIARVGPTIASTDGRLFSASVQLASDPESTEARSTLARIERAAKPIAASAGATFLAGGSPVFGRDTEHAIFGSLWKMVLFILLLSFLVLLVLMRSVLLPLKAVLMNLLSVGATYGLLVAIFQWGWLDWTGYRSPGYVDTLVPPLILAINFGLSMDYEVFLLSRIREQYMEHRDNDRAVSEGVVLSARIITSAALIMVGVFSAFAVASGVTLKQLGFGLAIAVALDSTIVRLVIVPSTMKLLGDWNWWLPGWLDRVLPAGPAAPQAQS